MQQYMLIINEDERRALQQACREFEPKMEMRENALCRQAVLRELDQRLLTLRPAVVQRLA